MGSGKDHDDGELHTTIELGVELTLNELSRSRHDGAGHGTERTRMAMRCSAGGVSTTLAGRRCIPSTRRCGRRQRVERVTASDGQRSTARRAWPDANVRRPRHTSKRTRTGSNDPLERKPRSPAFHTSHQRTTFISPSKDDDDDEPPTNDTGRGVPSRRRARSPAFDVYRQRGVGWGSEAWSGRVGDVRASTTETATTSVGHGMAGQGGVRDGHVVKG